MTKLKLNLLAGTTLVLKNIYVWTDGWIDGLVAQCSTNIGPFNLRLDWFVEES